MLFPQPPPGWPTQRSWATRLAGKLSPNLRKPLSSPSLVWFCYFLGLHLDRGKPVNIYEASAATIGFRLRGCKNLPVELVKMQVPRPHPHRFSLSVAEVEPRKLHYKQSTEVILLQQSGNPKLRNRKTTTSSVLGGGHLRPKLRSRASRDY